MPRVAPSSRAAAHGPAGRLPRAHLDLTTELPFAGRPTLGTARAWLDAGGVPRTPGRVVQECGVGLVPVRIDDEMLAFAAPPLIRSDPAADADLAEALSSWASTEPAWWRPGGSTTVPAGWACC